jgi:threonine dehydratase
VALETARVSLAEIEAAAERIRHYVQRTPLLAADPILGEDCWFKAESLQRTGSFKVRGAANALLQLSEEQRRQGVITLSAGNHGRALAYMARRLKIPCVVVIRDDAPLAKLEAIRREGAELVLVAMAEWQARLDAEQRRRGLHLVHPFDDPAVIAGQGTVGLEIVETLPDAATVVIPVGGGGLISGVAIAVKSRVPAARVIGVEPERAAVVSESLAAGHPVAPSRNDSVAEGLAPPYTRAFNLEIIQRYVDEMRLVTDEAIVDALKALALDAKLVLEPAGAAAVAAVRADASIRRPLVTILTGGNVDGQRLASWLA